MNIGLYILDGQTPVQESDTIKWSKWFESNERQVKRDIIYTPEKTYKFVISKHPITNKPTRTRVFYTKDIEVLISTVFLGLDHSWNGGEPLLFETMIFGGKYDGEMCRCSTWQQAEIMHNDVIEFTRNKKDER